MSDNPHQPKPHEGDDELLQEEENEQERVEDLSDQDAQQIGATVQNFGGFMFLKTDRFQKFKNAYNTLTDPKLAENLLDLDHPENLTQTQSAISISRHELAKKGNMTRGYTESRFLFWKSNRLTPDQLYRARYATIVSKRIHRNVNRNTQELKIQNYLNRFGSSDSDKTNLRKSLNEWLKNNKHRNLDDALVSETRRQYYERGESFGKKEERELRTNLDQTRKTVINGMKGEIDRGTVVIKNALNPNTPSPDVGGLRPEIKQMETGKIAPVVPTIAPATPTTAPPIPPVINTSKVSVPGISGLRGQFSEFLKKSAALQAMRTLMRNVLASSINALRGVGLRSGAKLVLSFARSALPFLFKTASRAAITAAGTAASLGTSLVAQAGLEVLKKVPLIGNVAKVLDDALMGMVKALAILIIGVPIAIIILVLFAGPSLNTIPNYGAQNSMKVSLKNPTQRFVWSDFERDFLSSKKVKVENTNLSWDVFEKNYLQESLP